MSTAINLAPVTAAMRRLEDSLKWGTGGEHPGLADAAHATADHMGAALELIRAMFSGPAVYSCELAGARSS